MSKLPCPFCGCVGAYLDECRLDPMELNWFMYCCKICSAEGPIATEAEEALELYNKRNKDH